MRLTSLSFYHDLNSTIDKLNATNTKLYFYKCLCVVTFPTDSFIGSIDEQKKINCLNYLEEKNFMVHKK